MDVKSVSHVLTKRMVLSCAGEVNGKAMRNLFDAYDDNKDGSIDEGLPRLMAFS